VSVPERAVRGVFWAYATFGLERLTNFAVSLILARALLPAEFGLIAFALLLVGFAEIIRDLGVRDALVWAPEPIEPAADTCFWLSVGLGLLLAGTLLLSAPLAALMIGDPEAASALKVMAVVPLIGSLGLTHEALLMRRLDFRSRYAGDLAAALAKAVVAIGLVIAGSGVWALVTAQICSAVVRTASRWVLLRWRPRLRFTPADMRRLLGYGLPLYAAVLLDALAERVDQLVIAGLLGPVQLGYYYLAVRVCEMTLTGFNVVLTRVAFPSFVSLRDDRAALLGGVEAAMRFTSYILIPAAVGIALVSPEIVSVLFGERWLPAAPILSILAMAALVYALLWPIGDMVKAVGRTGLFSVVAALNLVAILACVTLFAKVGQSGVAVAFGFLAAAILSALVWLAVQHRLLGGLALLQTLAAPGGATLIMAFAVEAVSAVLSGQPAWLVLGAVVPTGAVVYGIGLWFAAAEHLRAAARHVAQAFGPAAQGGSA
jgi:lipopolysaccharide exporter